MSLPTGSCHVKCFPFRITLLNDTVMIYAACVLTAPPAPAAPFGAVSFSLPFAAPIGAAPAGVEFVPVPDRSSKDFDRHE